MSGPPNSSNWASPANFFFEKISGRRGSNPRPSPWQGDILPLNYFRTCNRRNAEKPTEAQRKIFNFSTSGNSVFLYLLCFCGCISDKFIILFNTMPESDYLIKAISKNGAFRAIAVSTCNITEEARQRHNLSHTGIVALGRAFACGILLCYTIRKTKGHITLKIKGDGPLGGIIVDASNEGTVRGYVNHPQVECFDKKGYVDIDKAVGKIGYVHVSYDTDKGIPFQSSVELVSGEIAKDVVNYLANSEQIPSYLSCGIYLEPKSGKVLHAGGIIIQTLPGAKEEDIKLLEEKVSRADPFSIQLRSGLTLEQITKNILSDFEVEILSEFEGLCFYCGCSQERFESILSTLTKNEIKKIIGEVGYAEGRCHFCNNVYLVKKEELEKILNNLR